MRARLATRFPSAAWATLAPWLPAPFVVVGAVYLANSQLEHHARWLGTDAHIYYRGAVAWLHGVDPWSVGYNRLHFAAPPWTLAVVAPFTFLRETRFVEAWILLDALAAAYIIWRTGLSWLWMAFPPLVHGTLDANPAIVAVALVLGGAGPVGALLRPQIGYALVGERRWRALAISLVIGVILVAILPIHTFLADLPQILARYSAESGGGATGGSPAAFVIGIVSVLVLATFDVRAAGWLATIVAVPINGWYAGAAALPVLNPILAIGLALPVVGLPTATIAMYVAIRVIVRRTPNGRLSRILTPLHAPYATRLRRWVRRSQSAASTTGSPSSTPG